MGEKGLPGSAQAKSFLVPKTATMWFLEVYTETYMIAIWSS